MTPLQVFFALAGLLLTVILGLAVYLVPKHRVRQKFFDRALGNSGADGMPKQDDIFTTLENVVHQLNGGGFGGQITALDKKFTDHIEESSEDRRQIRADVADVARLFSMQIQKLDEKVTDNLEKVTGDLHIERDRARYLEASLNEVLEISADEAPDLD